MTVKPNKGGSKGLFVFSLEVFSPKVISNGTSASISFPLTTFNKSLVLSKAIFPNGTRLLGPQDTGITISESSALRFPERLSALRYSISALRLGIKSLFIP